MSGNRTCPAFIRSVNEHKQRNSEGNYRFYPIVGDIRTMELIDGSYGPDFPDFTDAPKGNRGAKGHREQENHQDKEEEEEAIRQGETGGFGVLGPVRSWANEDPNMQNTSQRQFQFSFSE
ncbi:hypothetical protein M378DRAFT_182230 [Amanita muscaria Koide BX008]|uniref:Uncharacterized protein n=1 Tax=Amanita muscaria (strain Koide BX008) TaxID=946122 RepID=A0A0C2WH66_AMAMK|nr:hypothetical protein M378DRAFT_182230 [Amanita muscaria Koide BX008]